MSAVKPVRTVLCSAALLCAAPATAEPAPELERGIAALRDTGSCGALRHDPIAEQVAEISNRSTEEYHNHDARFVPVADPLFVLRDLGGTAGKAIQLQGYGSTDVDAIKGVLLQGHISIPDCSYDTLGTSVIRNPDRGYTLVVAVLAGP